MMTSNRKIWLVPIMVIAMAGLMISGCATPPEVGTLKKETAPSSSKSTDQQTTKPVPGKIEGYEIYENNDPFQPKLGAGASTTVTTTTTSTGGTTTSSATLVSVSTDLTTATITVNGTTYTDIPQGSTFASNYRLISISAGSVVIMYGDNQYTLYLGQAMTLK
jgi:uncharacterized lipoprotein YajG